MTQKRKTIFIAGIVLIAVLLSIIVFTIGSHSLNGERELPICSVQREQKMASITFDIVQGNDDTQQIIDILGKYNIKATFFVVGEWVDTYPESVKALSGAGHEVMNLSNTYAHLSNLSQEVIIADVEACNDKLEAVTGMRPTLIRPPYDEYSGTLISAVRSIGVEPILWDVDSRDQEGIEASGMLKEVTSNVQAGSIIRFHMNSPHTPEALPDIIKSLLLDGYCFVPVSQLLLPEPYTIDQKSGRQLSSSTKSLPTDRAYNYFDSARLNRQQIRDNALSPLQQAGADEEVDRSKKEEANQAIQTIAGLTISEAQIETRVIAQGYQDCVAFIGDKSVSVVVAINGYGLTDADVDKIIKIVQDETGMAASQINVIEANQ